MFDIPSYCTTRETELEKAGIHIAEILKRAGVDRSSWTGWKNRGKLPQLKKLERVDREIKRALAEAERAA